MGSEFWNDLSDLEIRINECKMTNYCYFSWVTNSIDQNQTPSGRLYGRSGSALFVTPYGWKSHSGAMILIKNGHNYFGSSFLSDPGPWLPGLFA